MKIKHVLLAAVLMGSLSATAKDYHYTTIPGDAMKTRIYTLDNGLTVYKSTRKSLVCRLISPSRLVPETTLPRQPVLPTIWST